MLKINDITFGYNPGQNIFSHFTWEVNEGEHWTVIGPSGVGKTTLLYLLSGILMPVRGNITYDNVKIQQPNLEIGFVSEDLGLVPWLNVEQNVALGFRIKNIKTLKHLVIDLMSLGITEEERGIVSDWLNKLQIKDIATQAPNKISAGQKQRVAIARALVLQRKILMMDEPLKSLDAATKQETQSLLQDYFIEGYCKASIIVTHNLDEAISMGDKILVLGRLSSKVFIKSSQTTQEILREKLFAELLRI